MEALDTERAKEVPQAIAAPHGRILVYLDTPEETAEYASLLQQHNYEVRAIRNDDELLSRAATEVPDLILVSRPGAYSGPSDVLRALREEMRWPAAVYSIAVAVVASAPGDLYVSSEGFFPAVHDFYLERPIDGPGILAFVRSFLSH